MTDNATPNRHRIVVPVDFSPSSYNAMEYAAAMAKKLDNSILLVYVINPNRFTTLFTGSDTRRLVREGIEARMAEYKESLTKLAPDTEIDHKILEGKPYKVIQELTNEEVTDMVVMGTNGETGIERFMGSTTRRVLSSAHVPVVAVKNKVDNPKFDTIVLPIDFTKTSKQKVNWAVRLAKLFDSTIHVIMELETDEFLKKKVHANLHQVEQHLKENDVNFVSKLLDEKRYPDNIGRDTIQYAAEIRADLIVIMTQQETIGLGQFFIGNYAEQVVLSSQNIPVMSINPRQTTKFDGGSGFY